ncbi:TPA: glycine dehydrogenase subunit 2 [Candidatus Acetothermia bacterium]|nr:glycine dehydrogenase subunit 2 [Candidatus Acetothermia bacterium]
MSGKETGFHQARWNEPIIYDLTSLGERGILVPAAEAEIRNRVGDVISHIPEGMRRKSAANLPEMGQSRVLQHYLRLAQETLGRDLNIDVGQGTCTMKYNPPINEAFITTPKIADLHPLQDERTVQGVLEIVYRLDKFMREISGLDRFSLQPGGGSHAIYTMASMVRAYFEEKGEKRDEIVTTLFSHPSDAAVPRLKGYKVIIVPAEEDGFVRRSSLEKVVSERTAALFITNPEDTGIFNPHIRQFTDLVHAAGGLCGYDQANANGILGITRAKEAGFDMSFFNLHKTFSSPHGCGGPGSGAIGVTDELAPFLPVPLIGYDEKNDRYFLDYDIDHTIGKVKDYYGVIPAVVRAYAWIMSLGAEGLRQVARVAVLNNNYLLHKMLKIKGVDAPFAPGKHRLEQVRYSWEELAKETGVQTTDIQRRVADFGGHYWMSHEPWVVPQPVTLEPTESYSKIELDTYVSILERIAHEAYEDPDLVKGAPYNSTIDKMDDHSYLDDPEKWAITWRGYQKKYSRYFEPKVDDPEKG